MADHDDDYEIGYRKPPQETRFAKGTSGNPNGRPKGSQNMGTIFNRIAREHVQMNENGKKRTVPKIEAVQYQLMNKALSGDAKAMREVLQWQRIFEAAEDAEEVSSAPHERDAIVMKSFLKRIHLMNNPSTPEGLAPADNDLNKEKK